jgi:hypothetical protein
LGDRSFRKAQGGHLQRKCVGQGFTTAVKSTLTR